MIIHDCIQGSQEWLSLRAGIPTASEFDSILTPGGKLSAAADKYMYRLLAERIMGHPTLQAVTTWMDRGTELEKRAVGCYEFITDTETVKVGFMTNDSTTIGASPDRLVGDLGLLEIKCPSEAIHVGYLLSNKGVDKAYYPQVQGQLWIAERQWADVLSWHPEMPEALIRVERDEEYIEKLAGEVMKFSARLEAMTEQLKRDCIIKPKATPKEYGAEFLTPEQEEALYIGIREQNLSAMREQMAG